MGQFPKNRLQAYMPMEDLEKQRDFSFQDIRGFKIMNTTGHQVGHVKNIFVDPNTLEPCFALLDYEKFMNFNVKSLLVPWEELRIGDDFVQTRWTEDQLLPETRAEQERNLAGHGGPARRISTPGTSSSSIFDTDEGNDTDEVTSYDTGEGDEELVTGAGRA
ncbi:MAG: PRC-barrel domain-containing protein [Armatimonadota bacterium]